MKKIFFLLMIVLLSSKINAQIEHIDLLILKQEKEVSNYLDSLFSLKNNPSYKIEKDITNSGGLVYKASFSIEDQKFYTCLSIYMVFERIEGIEYCVKQFIFGDLEFANPNLIFIKDNFKSISNGVWEKSISNNNSIKLVAKFERTEDKYPTYSIKYTLDFKK